MHALMGSISESCLDGRKCTAAVGVPGGNAGQLVLALAAAEKVLGRPFDLSTIGAILARWIDKSGEFYMHTDEVHALKHLQISKEEVLRPPRDQQESLLELLVLPANIGCGHLRLMVQYPDEYGVRKELVQEVIKAVYRRVWSGQGNVELEVLKHDHTEGAVVIVDLKYDIAGSTRIPTLIPMSTGDVQMFVYHPQAEAYMLNAVVEHMHHIVDNPVDRQALLEEMTALAYVQLSGTVGHLAPTLPIYKAVFGRDQQLIRVEEVS
jgi:hypothetical protein